MSAELPKQWFCKILDEQLGPLNAKEISALAQSGKLGPEDLVQRSNMERWMAAKTLKGLNFVKLDFAQPSQEQHPVAFVGSTTDSHQEVSDPPKSSTSEEGEYTSDNHASLASDTVSMKSRIRISETFNLKAEKKGWVRDSSIQKGSRLEHETPQCMRSSIARLMHGRFLLRAIPPQNSATIAASSGRKLVEVQIDAPEVVYFKMERFVGMVGAQFTGGSVSFSAMAFSLGHTFLHGVRGPGYAYYESSGASVEVLTENAAGENSFDPRSIVCFGSNTEFRLTSGLRSMSLAFGDWQLELIRGWVVIDLGDSALLGALGPFIPLLRKIYWPF